MVFKSEADVIWLRSTTSHCQHIPFSVTQRCVRAPLSLLSLTLSLAFSMISPLLFITARAPSPLPSSLVALLLSRPSLSLWLCPTGRDRICYKEQQPHQEPGKIFFCDLFTLHWRAITLKTDNLIARSLQCAQIDFFYIPSFSLLCFAVMNLKWRSDNVNRDCWG